MNTNININNEVALIQQIDCIIDTLGKLKEPITNSKMCMPPGYKIVYVPKNVKKITYNVGRFVVTQNLCPK